MKLYGIASGDSGVQATLVAIVIAVCTSPPDVRAFYQDVLPNPTEVQLEAEALRRLLKTGDFVPIGVNDLQQRIKVARENVGPAFENRLGRLTYTAALDGSRLTGRFAADITVENPHALLPLGKPSLRGLQFDGDAAIGASRAGGLFFLPLSNSNLSGRFALDGQKRAWGYEFSFTGLHAETSTLKLSLPSGMSVTTDATEPTRSPARAGRRDWTVLLSPSGPTRITIRDSQSVVAAAPMVDHRVTWSAAEQEASFRAEYQIQTTTPLSGFSIPLPNGCSIESVSYGDAVALAIDIVDDQSQRVLEVRLPAALRGASRTLSVTGRLPAILGRPWRLPTLALSRCQSTEGRRVSVSGGRLSQLVRVRSPLEIKAMRLNGYDQRNSVVGTDGSHTVTLARVQPGAEATITIGTPRKRTTMTDITRIKPETTGWTTETLLLATTALPARISVDIPDGFTPLSVVAGRDSTPCRFTVEKSGVSQRLEISPPATDIRFLRVRGFVADAMLLPLFDAASGQATRINRRCVLVPQLLQTTPPIVDLAREELDSILQPHGARFTDGDGDEVLAELPQSGRLVVQRRRAKEEEPAPTTVADVRPQTAVVQMRVVSDIRSGHSADNHRATIEVSGRGDLEFQLAQHAEVLSLTVDGRSSRFQRRGDQVIVPLGTAQRRTVTLRYRVPHEASGLLFENTEVPLPVFSVPANLQWSVRLPDGCRLEACKPFGPDERQATAVPGPVRALCGPLWPRDDTVVHIDAVTFPFSPASLNLVLSDTNRAHSCSWLAMATLAAFGSLFATSPKRTRILCFALGLMAFAICVLAATGREAYGLIAAGAFWGLLVPSVLGGVIHRRPSARDTSTVLQSTAALTTVLLLLMSPTLCTGQVDGAIPFRIYRVAGQETAFVKREWLDRIDRGANTVRPAWLLRTGRYKIDAGGTPIVTATLSGVVPGGLLPSEIYLPFGNLNPQRCEINGQEVVWRRDDSTIIARLSDLVIDQDETEEGTTDPTHELQIEVVFRPPSIDDQVRFKIPAAATSQAIVASGDTKLFINGVAASDSPQVVTGEIRVGMTRDIAQPDESETRFQNQCKITVTTDSVTLQHKLLVQPGSDPIRHLDLAFPSSQHFVSLQCEIPVQKRVIDVAAGRFLAMDFDEPVSEAFEVDLSLTDKSPRVRGACRVELRPLITEGSKETAVLATSDRLAVTNLRVESASDVDRQAQPIDISDPITLTAPMVIEGDVKVRQATRATQSVQTVTVGPDGVDYGLEATVRVVDGPVFQHTLRVSPDLQIDTVSVREGNVDRLARYQRTGEKLVLLLEVRTSGTQEVIVRGRKRLKPGQPVTIPTIDFPGGTPESSTLILVANSGVDMKLTDVDSSAGEAQRIRQKSFDLLATPKLPVFMADRPQPTRITQLFLPDPTRADGGAGTWHVRCQRGTSDDTLVAVLPTGDLEILRGLEQSTQTGPSTLRLTEKIGHLRHSVSFDSAAPVPAIGWGNNVRTRTIVALPSDADLEVANASRVEATIPAWIRQTVGSDVALVEVADHVVRLHASTKVETEDVASVSFVEHHVWLDSGVLAGRTQLLTTSGGRLPLKLPANGERLAVSINGFVQSGNSESIRVPSGENTVSVGWKATAENVAVPQVSGTAEHFVVLHGVGLENLQPLSAATVLTAESLMAQRPATSGFRSIRVTDTDTILMIAPDASEAVGRPAATGLNWLSAALLSTGLVLALILSQKMKPESRIVAALLVPGVVLVVAGNLVGGSITIIIAVALRYSRGWLRWVKTDLA